MIIYKIQSITNLHRLRLEVEHLIKNVEFSLEIPNQLSLQVSDPGDTSKSSWWCSIGKINLPGRKKIVEEDYIHIHPQLRGGAIDSWIRALPVNVHRLRLLLVPPKGCYSIHRDPKPRIHLPITTNSGALIVLPDKQVVSHLPADGGVWWVDTRESHTVVNCGVDVRVHLVGVTDCLTPAQNKVG